MGKAVDNSGHAAISKHPIKIAIKAGATDAVTWPIGFENIADAKKMLRPAGGQRKPISIVARKMIPK